MAKKDPGPASPRTQAKVKTAASPTLRRASTTGITPKAASSSPSMKPRRSSVGDIPGFGRDTTPPKDEPSPVEAQSAGQRFKGAVQKVRQSVDLGLADAAAGMP